MIKLNSYEENLEDKKDLVYHWLCTNEISYEEITTLYVSKIENERSYYLSTLCKSDVYVATLIDNKKKNIDYQIPFAIKYVLENKRMYGTKWYEELEKGENNED